MLLIDLDPQWIVRNGKRIGFTFYSPVQGLHGKTRWRQSCFAMPTPGDVQWEVFGDKCVQHCNPGCGWMIDGGIENADFETLTVRPSIDGSAGGLWHGFITNGEVK